MAPLIQSAKPMHLFELYWASGGVGGTLTIWAPDSRTAIATVEEHPSRFGIPHENPIVGHPRRLPFAERATAA